jgi:hypothetical protein
MVGGGCGRSHDLDSVAVSLADGPVGVREIVARFPDSEQTEKIEAMGRVRSPYAAEALEPFPGPRSSQGQKGCEEGAPPCKDEERIGRCREAGMH